MFEPVYAGAIVTAILCGGFAAKACIPDEAIERATITANEIETCSTGTRAYSLGGCFPVPAHMNNIIEMYGAVSTSDPQF